MKNILFYMGEAPSRLEEVTTAIKAFVYNNSETHLSLLGEKKYIGALASEKSVEFFETAGDGSARALRLLKNKGNDALIALTSFDALLKEVDLPLGLGYLFEGVSKGHQSFLLLAPEEMSSTALSKMIEESLHYLDLVNGENVEKPSLGLLGFPAEWLKDVQVKRSAPLSVESLSIDALLKGEKNLYLCPLKEGRFLVAGLNAGKRFEEERADQAIANSKNPFVSLFGKNKKRKLEIIEETAFVYGLGKPVLLFPKDVSYASAMGGLRAIEKLLGEAR